MDQIDIRQLTSLLGSCDVDEEDSGYVSSEYQLKSS